jgi:predicted RND superfamily exporter protein
VSRERFDEMTVVRRVEEFDRRSGSWLERLVFNHRLAVVVAAALLTAALGAVAASRSVVNADFVKMMPARHPFVRAYLENAAELRGLGNSLRVAVEATRGDVYDPEYLEALRRITDELVLIPGSDRPWVKSIWMPSVRWTEVTEEGFRGGPVMPDDYDGSPAAVAALRRNVLRAGVVGNLVASDARSAVVFVPLHDRDPVTGAGIDYPALSRRLEDLRERFEGAPGARVRLHVVGFAKLVAELLAGIRAVMGWFAVAAAIAAGALLAYTRCLRSTALVVLCSATAVVWQVGIVTALGIPLDPFSVLVPFLVFALGVSHGAQKMNGIMQDVGRGTHRLVAARYTFRRLFAAGLTALLTDVVGFAVLATIEIPIVRELAFTASVGAVVLVFTNLLLFPVLLSFTGVSPAAAARSLRSEATGREGSRLWRCLERFTERPRALVVIAVAAAITAGCLLARRDLRVGDLEAGAPELRASSRYNRDDAFFAAHYGSANDVFAAFVRTPREGCLAWRTLVDADRLEWALQQLPSVRATASLAGAVRRITAGSLEGNPKWLTLSRDQPVLNYAAQQAITANPDLVNAECSALPVVAHLADHRAETLEEVVRVADAFARRHGDPGRRFLLAAGNAGIQAATNEVVRDARWKMALCAYGAVALLCLGAFRSWRATLVTMIPLACTGVACEAVMVALGIGMKVATLPVIALGVGIPDFALYLLSIQLAHQRAGLPLDAAYGRALRFTGKVVVLVSVTLAAGVVTWAFSPLKLQADMGVLLTFMFLGNMVAALVLVPALSRLLLSGPGESRQAVLA